VLDDNKYTVGRGGHYLLLENAQLLQNHRLLLARGGQVRLANI
jgi:hypothetical protein